MKGDTAPRSMVPSTMILMLVRFPGCDGFFLRRTILNFSTNFDRLRFTLRAHGLRRLLRTANYISAPCGWEQGAKWDQVRVGSGEPSRGLLCFPAFLGEYSHGIENSTECTSLGL